MKGIRLGRARARHTVASCASAGRRRSFAPMALAVVSATAAWAATSGASLAPASGAGTSGTSAAGTSGTSALATGSLSASGGPTASAARTVYLRETGRLRLLSEKGNTITEHGYATGTYNAPVTATFAIHPKSVVASVTIHPRGGSISGTANASYKIQGKLGYFGGTFLLSHGTGSFRHAAGLHGQPLGISGIINRTTLEVEVKANGWATGL